MGVFGTVLTMMLALPATALASRTVSPHPAVFHASRQVLNFLRAMPDALIAMVLVQGFGLGPLPGALALGLHSGGFIGKTLSERCERLDPKVLEGLRSCGASWVQVMRFGVWPSIEREIVGECLYILDRNVRVATTLGLVGAGGIGMKLMTDLRTFHAADAATVIVCVMGLILLVDVASTVIRRRLA
jgi:phosphonate transport system permease protein